MKAFAELYYKKSILPWLLLPIAWVYGLIIRLRCYCFKKKLFKSYKAPVPIIIVGNITLGGTGKTPLVIALVEYLKTQGFKPGVVSRGYGSKAESYPYVIDKESSTTTEAGDEPFLIHLRGQVPVVIAPNRPDAVKKLLKEFQCDVIISDDGLQHYALQRDIEIAVVDSKRGLGNGRLFPAGPLRESKKRLRKVDMVVCNGEQLYKNSFAMRLMGAEIKSLATDKVFEPHFFQDKKLIAIAGIGNPARFFESLHNLGLTFQKQPMPDHYKYSKHDFEKDTYYLMTEKDAVKCKDFISDKMFYLPVAAELSDPFYSDLLEKLVQKVK